LIDEESSLLSAASMRKSQGFSESTSHGRASISEEGEKEEEEREIVHVTNILFRSSQSRMSSAGRKSELEMT
jgi:hypothetical protein